MMNDKVQARFSIAPDVVSCQLQDQTVLLDTRQGSYFTLNPVAAECWGLLGVSRGLDELTEQIAQSYEIDAAECRVDIAALLTELVDAGLVQAIPDERPVDA